MQLTRLRQEIDFLYQSVQIDRGNQFSSLLRPEMFGSQSFSRLLFERSAFEEGVLQERKRQRIERSESEYDFDTEDADPSSIEPEYRVRKIIGKRITTDELGRERVDYQVEWKSTWATASSLNCQGKVQQFNESASSVPRN